MEQKIKLKYINTNLNIGMVSWRIMYLLFPQNKYLKYLKLIKGNLMYRLKDSAKQFSYKLIKNDLTIPNKSIIETYPDWL